MEQISCYSGQIGLMADENASRLGLQIRTTIPHNTHRLNVLRTPTMISRCVCFLGVSHS